MHTSWPVAITVFALAVFVVPFCEEVVFRGLLWGALERRWGRAVALSVSTVLFALAHLELQRLPILLVLAVPIALARFYSGGVAASFVAHAINNALPSFVLMLSMTGAIVT